MGLLNSGIFDGKTYSNRRWDLSRTIGKKGPPRVPWKIENPNKLGGRRGSGGKWESNLLPGFFPQKPSSPFHPSGNSLGYAIQWAHIMGASQVTLLGFTGEQSGGYDWGDINPAKRKVWKRDQRRIDHYCQWVEKAKPGWVRLEPGWNGRIYGIFRTRETGPQNVHDAPW